MELSSVSVLDERVLFASDMHPEVNARMQAAVAHADDFERAYDLMQQANAIDPNELQVYIAMYKFLFYRGHLSRAEEVARKALRQSAEQGNFSVAWELLTPESADWSLPQGPERVYLYSMKALAFILLRSGDSRQGGALLDKLAELDPLDQVGSSVIRQLAEAL